MDREKPFGKANRLLRMTHLLTRIRPARVPFTHRQNRITLYEDGSRFFPSLYEAVRKAERFILAEYYLVRNDRTGTALASELTEAVRRGVRVLLIYDYIGSIDTPAGFFRDLSATGIEVVPFNVPSFHRGIHWFDRRDHRKMAVIDGSLAFVGGFNIGDEYSDLAENPQRFYDLGFSIQGSAVQELVQIFTETWFLERGTLPFLPLGVDRDRSRIEPQEGGDVIIVSGGPGQRRSRIRNTFLVNIAAASEEILIITPYFIPGPRVIRALLRAARRGVRVRLLLPARCDVPLIRFLARAYYGILLKEGIGIREMEEEILHAKVMLIDGKQAVIGSANFDQRSFHRNYEINFMISDNDLSGRIRAIHQKDFIKSRPIVLAEHERRGLIVRVLEKIIGLFSWFL